MTALELSKKYNTLLKQRRIDTPLRLAHFFTQLDHESKLIPRRESFNYSLPRLLQVFKKYFTPYAAAKIIGNQQLIANTVYANRMGNGDIKSGDGWRFRGGGLLQHTGTNEYKILTARTGVDFYNHTELLEDEVNSLIAAIDFWNRLGLSTYADQDNLDTISDLINIGRKTEAIGDANGFADRATKLKYYKTIFK